MVVTDTDRAAIRQVIEQQLLAFQHDDAAAAFQYASPEIQAQFQTPQQFMDMVKTQYKAVYRPRSVMLQDVTIIEQTPAQKVIFLDPHGEVMMAIYLMQRQGDLSWRVNGCVLVPLQKEG